MIQLDKDDVGNRIGNSLMPDLAEVKINKSGELKLQSDLGPPPKANEHMDHSRRTTTSMSENGVSKNKVKIK